MKNFACVMLLASCTFAYNEFATLDMGSLDIESYDFSMDFSMGTSMDISINYQPSPMPTPSLSTAAPSHLPSSYDFDTKTEFNYDFSIRIYNISVLQFSSSMDMQEASREAVADMHRNLSYSDISILNITNITDIDRRSLKSFSVYQNPTILKSSSTNVDTSVFVVISFRVRGVLERWGRFSQSQQDAAFEDMDSLFMAYISEGSFQAALESHFRERGFFFLFSLDRTYFRRISSSSLHHIISTAPTPVPTPVPTKTEEDKPGSVIPNGTNGLGTMEVALLGGMLFVLLVLIIAVVHCIRESRIKHVSVGVGT